LGSKAAPRADVHRARVGEGLGRAESFVDESQSAGVRSKVPKSVLRRLIDNISLPAGAVEEDVCGVVNNVGVVKAQSTCHLIRATGRNLDGAPCVIDGALK
jgi:hypothetical protein